MFRTKSYLVLTLLFGLFFSQHTFAQNYSAYKAGQKKLIELGWDIPEYTFVADNITAMESSPFEGVVFSLKVPKGSDKRGFSVCNTDLLTENLFDFSKMTKIRSKKLTDNFIFVFMQDDIDQSKFSWYDDAKWVNIRSNTKLLTKAVNTTAAKGIFLDTENYFSPCPWTYNATLYPNQTFQQVYDKVRQRGREYITALQADKSDIKVMYTFAYQQNPDFKSNSFQYTEYALMKPFIDGMLEAAGPQVTLINGNEASYWSSKNDIFTWWNKQSKVEYPKDRVPAELVTKYGKQFHLAYPILLNRYFNIPYGQQPFDFNYNVTLDYQNKWFQHDMYNNLLSTDEYVWTWTQGDVDWWKKSTFKNKQELINGINEAKAKIANGQPIGSVMKPAATPYQADFDDPAPFFATITGPAFGGNVPVGNVSFTLAANDISKLGSYRLCINAIEGDFTANPTQVLNLPAGKYTAWIFGSTKENKVFQTNHITFTVGAVVTLDTQAPSAPTSLTASNITTNSFTVTWTASTDDVAVASYDVFKDGVLAQNTIGTSFSLSGLNANTTYNITVKARDAANNISAASLPLSVKTLTAPLADTQAPTLPTNLTASNITTNSFTVTWTASTDNIAVKSYDVFKDGVLAQNTTTTSVNLNGLNANTTYNITVKARDAANNISAASSTMSVKTLVAPLVDTQAPTVPTKLAALNITTNSFTVTWAASADNVAVVSYDVYKDGVFAQNTTSTSINLTGLNANTIYNITVKARDAANNISAASLPLSVKTSVNNTSDNQAPTPPNYIQSYSVAETSFSLQWSGATDNIAVTGYEVFLNGISVGKTAQYTTYFNATKLQKNTNYNVAIKAYDAAGNVSIASKVLTVKTLDVLDWQAPTSPLNLNASNITTNSLALKWTASTDNVGVTKYTIFRNGLIFTTVAGNVTSLDIKYLESNTSYIFTINAADAANNLSAFSSPLLTKTLGTTNAKVSLECYDVDFSISKNAVKSSILIAEDLTPLELEKDAIVTIEKSAIVAPNPIQDFTTLTFYVENITPTIIRLVDEQGKIYFTQQVETQIGENQFQLDVSNLPSGMLLLNIANEGKVETLKVLIQR